ncbi:cytochrome P450 1A1-like [Antedon mediterranea]|uniref:cytochrome P450 1A1-like n=1 Tax=Antedon mediterranea TaxID=105859 RepID=UPI003AF605EA
MATQSENEDSNTKPTKCPVSGASKDLSGPAQYYLVGNLPQIRSEGRAPRTWTRWSNEFGPVFEVGLGPMGSGIVLSGASVLEKAYESDSENDNNFRDRWRPPALEKIGFVGSISWENWLEGAQDRKHFLQEVFKRMDIEGLIKKEAKEVCTVLYGDELVNVSDLLNQANNNILLASTINRSERFEYTDEQFHKLEEIIVSNSQHKFKGSPVNVLQWLWSTPLFNAMRYDHGRLETALQPYIDSHRETFKKDTIQDLIDGYLGGVGETSLDVNEIVNNVKHLFLFFYSLSSAIQWTILFIIQHSDVQDKVHEEIDRYIMDLEDISEDIIVSKMPYINAVIKESLRLATPIGQLMAHCPIKDTQFEGYTFKKGTPIFSNLWGPNHDAKSWPEPLAFKPERWLDMENDPPGFMPFGSGLRKCPAQGMSMTALRLFLVMIFKRFHLAGVDGEKLPSLDDSFMLTDTILPNKFNILATNRLLSEIN